MSIPRYLPDKCFTSLVQAIEKRTVATIQLVSRPSFDLDTIGFGSIDQVQCDLRLGLEDDVLGNVVFFRRAESLAHSSGRYNWASSRQ